MKEAGNRFSDPPLLLVFRAKFSRAHLDKISVF